MFNSAVGGLPPGTIHKVPGGGGYMSIHIQTVRGSRAGRLLMFAWWIATSSGAASAATLYWDGNNDTAGFGSASGTWAAPTTGTTTAGWSTSSAGTTVVNGNSVTTTTADTLYFGDGTNALGAGTITVSGTVSANSLNVGLNSGSITFSGGTIAFASDGNVAFIRSSTSGASAAGSIFTFDTDITKTGGSILFGTQSTANERYVVNGVISGTASFDNRIQNNTGGWTALNGLNTFTGGVSIVTGQLNVATVANSGAASALGAGSTVSLGGGGGQEPLLWYTGSGAGSTNRSFTTLSTGNARIVAQDGALTLAGTMTGGLNAATTYNYYFSGTASSGTNTVSGVISDGTGKTQVGVRSATPAGGSAEEGVWRFSGSNTYTAATTVENASTLIVANNTALGTTAAGTTISGTASLQFDGSGSDLTVAEPLTFNTTTNNGGIRNLAGTNTLTGLVTLQSNLDYRYNGGRLVFDGGITTANNSGLGLNGAATIQTAAANLGSATLGVTSSSSEADAVRIDVAGNTWGLTRINFNGYLRTGVDNALPASAGVEFGWSTDAFSTGTLDLAGTNQSVAFVRQTTSFPTVNGNQNITGGGTLTINTAAGTYDYRGRITNGVTATSIAKTGVGTQIFTNNSGTATSYTGTTDIQGGTLQLAAANSIGTAGTIRIGAGAELDTVLLSSFALGSQPLTFGLDPAGSGAAGLLDAAGLDVSLASLGFDLVGTLDDDAYVLANYTSLTGTFASTNLPTGYALDYDYQGGGQIALVAVPEPGQLLLGSFGLAALGGWLSRRQRLARRDR